MTYFIQSRKEVFSVHVNCWGLLGCSAWNGGGLGREMRDICRECTRSYYAASTNLSVGLLQNAMFSWIVYKGNIDCKATVTCIYVRMYVCWRGMLSNLFLAAGLELVLLHEQGNLMGFQGWNLIHTTNGLTLHMLVKIHTRIHTYDVWTNACTHAHTACT